MAALGLVECGPDIGQELLDLSIDSDVGNKKWIEKEVVEDEWRTKEVELTSDLFEDLSVTEINNMNISIVDSKDNKGEEFMEQHICVDSKSECETEPCINRKVHVCMVCNKIFATKKKLSDHKNHVHCPRELCDICQQTFTTKRNLQRHKDTVHYRCEVSSVCEKCVKSLIRTDKLRAHQEVYLSRNETE